MPLLLQALLLLPQLNWPPILGLDTSKHKQTDRHTHTHTRTQIDSILHPKFASSLAPILHHQQREGEGASGVTTFFLGWLLLLLPIG